MSTDRSAEDARGNLRDGVTIGAITGTLRRRRLVFSAALLSCVAGFTTAAYLLPPRYRAEALVVAEPMVPSNPDDESQYLSPEVNSERQLEAIRTLILRRSVLAAVAAELDLFPRAAGRVSEDELDGLRSRIRIRVEGEKTFAIGFEDRNRHRVTEVAARLAGLLVETARAQRQSRDQATTAFLESQIEALEAELTEQERAFAGYREQNLREVPDQIGTTLKLLDNLETRLADISKTLADEEARRTAIQREIAELRRQGVTPGPPQSPSVRSLDELKAALQSLRLRYTDEHPDVSRTKSEIRALEQALRDGTSEVAAPPEYSPLKQRYVQLEAEMAAAEGRLGRSRAERASLLEQGAELERRIEASPKHEMAMSVMTREIEGTRARHRALLERLHTASFDEGLGKTTEGAAYRILDAPRVPDAPFAPDRFRIVLMGLAAGLILGAAFAFLADQMDTSLRTPEEVEALTGLPVLACLPTHRPAKGREDGPSRTESRERPGIPVLAEPEGAAAEQYRILAARLTGGSSKRTCLLVTSPVGGEGKTTTAVNVSLALARMVSDGVLLVDADLGRPAVHAMLGIPLGDGLRRLLESPGDDPLTHCRSCRGIYVLEAGSYSEETRSALSSPLAHRIFLKLRQRFAYIVVDAPPVLAVAEGLILQHLVDATLLVVRARRTPRQALARALASLDVSRVAGIALNGVDPKGSAAYGYAYVHHVQLPRAATAEGGR